MSTKTPILLHTRTLTTLAARLEPPQYDRAVGEHQIVHLGVGGFHRAHLASYIDQLRRGGNLDWRLVGVGLLEGDRPLRDALTAQDCLYTLITVDPDGAEHPRVVGSLSEYLFAPEDGEAVLSALASPRTGIISLTITEGGYEVSPEGSFAPRSDLVLADLASPVGAVLRSALGTILVALERRRDTGAGPVTIMSCDNLPHNGEVAREAVTGFARRRSPDMLCWIEENVSFPSSMVDRITPVTTDQTRNDVAAHHGVQDAWPVRAESFLQWVLEDSFAAGRPAFDGVGVQLVPDVVPYEQMKLRLLNASHQVLGHLGLLAGLTTVDEAMHDDVISSFVGAYLRKEAVPTLAPVPGIDLEQYCRSLEERFAGGAVRDTLARQVAQASDRIATFLLPVVRDCLAAGRGAPHAATVLAAWCRLLERSARDYSLEEQLSDPHREQLVAAALAEANHPGAFLGTDEVFGDLGQSSALRAHFRAAWSALSGEDPTAALRTLPTRS